MNPIPLAPLATASPPGLHRIRIGCAGWAVPRQHRHYFAGAGSALERYASRLVVVEINSSFYRPHQRKTYERWASSVPTEFRFSVKVPKSITHEHSLAGTAPLVDRFLGECLQLDRKLGGVLVQLPPSLGFDARLANTFFGVLRRRLPDGIAIACEPRHASWFAPRVLAIWNRYQVNRISANPTPAERSGAELLPSPTGSWRYWRLHGSPRMYYSGYSHQDLVSLVPTLLQAARTSNVWVIFDNTAQGHAAGDALILESLIASAIRDHEGTEPDA